MTKLEKLIAKIEAAELGQFYYRNPSKGCMCAVGHVFEDCGFLDDVLRTPSNNGKYIWVLQDRYNGMFKQIESQYGLNKMDLDSLQSINDNEDDPEVRKRKVIQYLKKVGEIDG